MAGERTRTGTETDDLLKVATFLLSIVLFTLTMLITCLIKSCGGKLYRFMIDRGQTHAQGQAFMKIANELDNIRRDVAELHEQVSCLPPVCGNDYAKVRRRFSGKQEP